MNIFAIAGLSVAISCAILAVIALFFGRTPMQRLLFFFNVACALWGFGSFLAGIARSDADGVLAWRLANTGGFFLAPLFYHFVTLFTKTCQRKILYCAYIQAAICALLGFSTELLFNKTRYVFGVFYNVVTPLYLICIGIYLILVFLSYYKLIQFRRATKGYRRTQADYIIFGFSFGFLGGTSTFLPSFHIDLLYPFGNFGIVIYSSILCYAILHHRIIDFHLAARKSITYFLSIGLLYGIFILSAFTFTKVLSRFLYMTSSTSTIVSTLLVAVLFTPLKNRVQQFANRIFFRTSYNYTSVVRETGRELASSIDLQKTYRLFTDTFFDNFKLKNACLLALRDGYFEMAYSVGNASLLSSEEAGAASIGTSCNGKRLANCSSLSLLAREGGVVIRDNLSLLDNQNHVESVAEELQSYSGELAAPVFGDRELMFLLILGEKQSGDHFTAEDIDLVTTIASQASLALKNARLYDELRLRLEDIMHYQSELLNAKKLESIAILAAGIAHEINNPLTNASLNIELLQEKFRVGRLDAGDLQRLEIIEKNVDRAAVIARDLLHFSRQRDYEFKPLDVNELIRNSLAQLEYKLKNTEICLDLHDFPPVFGDMARLEQVFINVINNSIESMSQKGELQISSNYLDGYLEVTFRDTGSGIPHEVAGKVFDPFFTTKEIGEGTGLGLAICYGIIKEHHGGIELSSEPGKGTVVTVKLPVGNNL